MDRCPICGRLLIPGRSVNRHHILPKLKGGKEAFPIHTICHSKIHSMWSEAELAKVYKMAEALGETKEAVAVLYWETLKLDERMLTFISWVCKRPAEFKDSNRRVKDHSKPRKR